MLITFIEFRLIIEFIKLYYIQFKKHLMTLTILLRMISMQN